MLLVVAGGHFYGLRAKIGHGNNYHAAFVPSVASWGTSPMGNPNLGPRGSTYKENPKRAANAVRAFSIILPANVSASLAASH